MSDDINDYAGMSLERKRLLALKIVMDQISSIVFDGILSCDEQKLDYLLSSPEYLHDFVLSLLRSHLQIDDDDVNSELEEAVSLNRELITMIGEVVNDLQTFQSNQQCSNQEIISKIESFETLAKNEIKGMREEIERLKLGKG